MAKKKNPYKYTVASSQIVHDPRVIENDKTAAIIEKQFFNYTLRNIKVIDRFGFHNNVEPCVKSSLGKFVIRTTYRFTKGASRNCARNFFEQAEINPQQFPILELLKEDFENKDSADKAADIKHNSRRVDSDLIAITETIFDEESIFKNDIYSVEHDVVITARDETINKLSHPYDTLKNVEAKYETMLKNHNGVGISIDIIDNDNEIGNRYVFIGGNVLEIIPSRNAEIESGVYYTTLSKGVNGTEANTVRYDFGDNEKIIGLWPTREEAESAGDVKGLMSKQILELENQAKEMTHKHRMELEEINRTAKEEEQKRKDRISALEEESANRQAELNELQRQHEIKLTTQKQEFEEKRLRDQDYYERKSYQRKDVHEGLKVAGGILAAGLTIWALWSKSK